MKIGIITVHRAYNYGSVLQCYALQEYLKSLGHDVWVIDYRQLWTESVYKTFSIYYILKKIKHPRIIFRYIVSILQRRRMVKQRKMIFSSFMKHLHLTEPCTNNIPQDFDIYIIGSDQLWSHSCIGGEDSVYLGDFKKPKESKLIGYAISTNEKSLNVFGGQRLKRIISAFDYFTFREESLSVVTKNMTGVSIPIAIDPTILENCRIWEPFINPTWKNRNYIVVYQARNVQGNSHYLKDKAQLLADKISCEIVNLADMTYSVEDFISSIKYAKYVFTTSFHATVFSVLMKTPCFAIKLGDGNDLRYVDLLSKLGLSCEIFEKDFIPEPFHVDFSKIDEILLSVSQDSKLFLQNALE